MKHAESTYLKDSKSKAWLIRGYLDILLGFFPDCLWETSLPFNLNLQ
jgi:hypothetical protein